MRSNARVKFLLAILSTAVVLSCSGQKTASVQDAEFSTDLNQVTGINLIGQAEGTQIQIQAAQELKYNVFKLTDPERVMIDLIDARASSSIPEEIEGNDMIGRIKVQSIEDSLSTLVRLQVELTSSANYIAGFEGNQLVVRLMPAGMEPSDMDSDMMADAPEDSPLEESSFDDGDFDAGLELPPLGAAEADLPSIPEAPLEELEFEEDSTALSADTMTEPSLELPELNEADSFEPSLETPELAETEILPVPVPLPIVEEDEVAEAEPEVEVPALVVPELESESMMKAEADAQAEAPEVAEPAEALPVPVIVPEVIAAEEKESAQAQEDQNRVIVEPEGELSEQIATQEIPTTEFTDGASLLGTIDSKVYTGKRVSLEFQNASIQDVIRLIADVSKLNIIISDSVTGQITLKLVDVPWDQALDIILTSRGLDKIQHGNILRVAPVEELKKEREIALANDKAAKQLEPLRLKLFNVNYADAGDMSERIKNLLSERGKVDTDERTNTLIVEDIAETLSRVENLVKVLDTQTPQVRIESRIVQANDNFSRSIGIQWGPSLRLDESNGNQTSFQFPRSVNVNTVPPSPTDPTQAADIPVSFDYAASVSEFAVDAAEGTGSGAIGLRLGSVSDVFNIDLVLRYAEAEQAAKIVSRPSITVLDNEEASIIQGSRIPFLSTSSEGTEVQFQEAGIEIQVKPQITNDGAVILEVETRSNEPGSTAVAGNPIINIREASTQMLVKSGNTAVLGGVFRTADTFGTGGVPGLRNLPVIGWLFKGESKGVTRDEMLIFITPYILSDSRDPMINPNSETELNP